MMEKEKQATIPKKRLKNIFFTKKSKYRTQMRYFFILNYYIS